MQQQEETNAAAERQATLRLEKVKAINAAMQEVLAENQAEIIKRAKAKLIASGFAVEEIE